MFLKCEFPSWVLNQTMTQDFFTKGTGLIFALRTCRKLITSMAHCWDGPMIKKCISQILFPGWPYLRHKQAQTRWLTRDRHADTLTDQQANSPAAISINRQRSKKSSKLSSKRNFWKSQITDVGWSSSRPCKIQLSKCWSLPSCQAGNTKKEVPGIIQESWNYRDELKALCKGSKIIIPKSMHQKMLEQNRANGKRQVFYSGRTWARKYEQWSYGITPWVPVMSTSNPSSRSHYRPWDSQ